MIFIGFILLFLTGFSLTYLFKNKFNIYTLLGASFPLGFGVISIAAFVYQLIGIKTTVTSLWILFSLIIVVLNYFFIKQGKYKNELLTIKKIKFKFSYKDISIGWLFCFSIVLYIVYGISAKALFFPTTAYDTVTGYDYMAKVFAFEGVINNSIFDTLNPTQTIRISYPPYTWSSYAYPYMLGLEYSKITIVLLFISFLTLFYGIMRYYISHTISIICTLLLAATPEMIAMAALSLTNVIHAMFASLGVLYLIKYLESKNNAFFILGAVFISLNIWTRSDGIVFVFGGAFCILYKMLFIDKKYKKIQDYKQLIIIVIVPLLMFIMWQIYIIKVFSFDNSSAFKALFWDTNKLKETFRLIFLVVMSNQYYGVVVTFFLVLSLLNLYFVIKKKDKLPLLLVIIATFIAYSILYYQMDNDSDVFGFSLVSMVSSSFKRNFFCFIPLLSFYIGTNYIVSLASDKVFGKYEEE